MEPGPSNSRVWWIGGLLLAALGVAIRIHNAIHYPHGKGFDAAANWEYIARLREGFALPSPDAFWAAAHPPLYYWAAAGLDALLGGDDARAVLATRLLGALLGLLAIAVSVLLVRRLDPGNPRRAFIAGGLLLFLPVHLYMSAMLNEEIVAAAFVSFAAAGLALDLSKAGGTGLRRAAWLGVVAGLALFTKISGGLVIAAGSVAYALEGLRRRELFRGLSRGFVFGAVASVVGGWFFARNLYVYGYIYPHQLELHDIMLTMPPNVRVVLDYLRVPLVTLTYPAPLRPELLHSVWGSTYTTIWFDSHRHFLPRLHPDLLSAAQWLMLLGLLPTLGWLTGMARALRRRASGADAVLLLLTAFTLAGYAVFTWRNPSFVTVKGSYLLGLSVPFAWFASDALARWTRPGHLLAILVWFYLALLPCAVVLTFWHGLLFAKLDDPGLQWTPIPFERQPD
jgi:hypothetical protein